MKLFLTILIAISLAYLMGGVADNLAHIQFYQGGELVSALWGFVGICALAVVFVVIGFLVALGLFGILLLVLGGVFFGLLFAGFGLIWPWALIALCLYLIVRQNKGSQLQNYQ